MKILFKRIVLFIIPFLVIATIIDVVISRKMKNTYIISTENEVWNDIYDHKVTDPCLIYGSSRAKVHIDPTIIEEGSGISAYNFGQDGQSFDIQYLRHGIQIKENGYPKYIIHALDAFTLSKTEDLYNKEQFTPYLLWNMEMIGAVNKYKGYSYLDYFMPLARFYGNYERVKSSIKEFFHPTTHRERIKGYRIETRGWTDEYLENAKEEMGEFRIEINNKTKQLYENFIEECKANGVQLIAVYTPEHILGQEFITNRDSIVTVYSELYAKHNIPFINYTTDSICYNTDYFFNTMHLNRKGSILITQQLVKDLETMKIFKEKN